MTGEAAPEPAKENLRLARRVNRLETQLAQLEDIRDTNAKLLDRLMAELDEEKERSHALLLNVLPQAIIDRLTAGETTIADRYENVAVVFSDFVGFTEISARTSVAALVDELNSLFTSFDASCASLGVEKIKTIGDAYMAAAGLPGTREDHVAAAAELALVMRDAVSASGRGWQIRIGVHTGPAVAGVIGNRKFVYDLWGDTVNVASRLETTSQPGMIQVSADVAVALGEEFALEPRGEVELKGKGRMATYFLLARGGV